MEEFSPLDCATIVYRALTRAADFDKNSRVIKSKAFLRRTSDRNGVSVNYNCPPGDCGKGLSGIRGVASLHVGRVNSIGLYVLPSDNTHANIKDIPLRDSDENIAKAEQLADDLAEQARLWIEPNPTPPAEI